MEVKLRRAPSKTAKPRRLGRPPDPAKVEAVLAASWQLFLAHGVESVAIDTIAAAAGVSKATVYAHFPDKHALFQEGVRREMAKIETAQGIGQKPSEAASLRDVLIAFGMGIMNFLISPGAVDFYGSLSGELRRAPELARSFYEAGPGRTQANLAAILAGPLAADLEIPAPGAAAEMLLGMWQGTTGYRLMLGVDHEAVVNSISQRVTEGVDRFLRAFM
jgi:TetR/AcrR family transcriptional repressor of mexJK operon